MVNSRHDLLRRAAAEDPWLGLTSSRWKSFLRHMELPHPAGPSRTFPSTRLAARLMYQLEGRDNGAANRNGGAVCAEFAESRAASATIGGTTKHHDPS
jgi:hypothetical protein